MEEKAKAKKPFYKRWWVWAIVIVLVIGMFAPSDDTETKDNDQQATANQQSATMDSTDTNESESEEVAQDQKTEPKATPEEIKKAATSNDLMIWQCIKNTDVYYNNMVEKTKEVDAGTIIVAEFQAYCDEVVDYTSKFREHLQDVDDPAAADYKTAAANYISNITVLARDTKEFSETGDSDTFEDIQLGVQLISYCTGELIVARTDYLKQAGFTDDEITATLGEE